MAGIDIKDIIKTMREGAAIIDPEEDYMTIAAAEEQMSLTETSRKKDIDQAKGKLRELARVLEAARVSSTRPSTVPSAEQHAATLNRLDGTKYSLGKAINEAEDTLARKEAELQHLKEELQALEQEDPAAEHDLDATALRLAVYRGLGFEPVLDKNGRMQKMLIRAQSGDVHVLSFDDPKLSDTDHANLAWKLASS
ncbi:Spc24 domain-containing protein [Phanerochaete sordida]|uniref:Kinetochore protein Spc24 n=1 Tax=Phanerochaete sordida TaxID=48140 RepID=A0A9P3G2W6_9APHY|nr:Spc24 domain-containing protein [Phanerochaete sordida]